MVWLRVEAEIMASLRYTHAVVCRIPLSLRTRGEIELEEAKKQHETYVRLLREIGLDVIELPPDEKLPECVFVEDTAVICNGIALITRPGAPQRAKEVTTFGLSFFIQVNLLFTIWVNINELKLPPCFSQDVSSSTFLIRL